MKLSVPQRARAIDRSLGTYRAARFLFKRGVPLFCAKVILGFPVRECDLIPNGTIEIVEGC